MFELVNIFEVFLPQLLHDPNPKDPLNGEAAMLLLKDPVKYKAKVMEHVMKYAAKDKFPTKDIITNQSKFSTNTKDINHEMSQSARNGISHNGDESKSVHSELSNASDYHSD